jgi:peptidoglycan/xylan/chitin deacetylase (PgdA/CDA1 family)
LWGERIPGVICRLPDEGSDGAPRLALTLDACGGGYDEGLLHFLAQRGVPATLFVTNLWIRAHPGPFRELAANGLFRIEAHGARHKPASVTGRSACGIGGTTSVQDLIAEVEDNAREIESVTGKRPRWFRSGAAHYDDVAVKVLAALAMQPAGYSVSIDLGASLGPRAVRDRALAARNGDILLAHMNRPRGGTGQGVREAVDILLARGWRFVPLP